MIVCLIFGSACGGNSGAGDDNAGTGVKEDASAWEPARAEKETASELLRSMSSLDEIGPGSEWSIIAIARSSLGDGPEAQAVFGRYRDELRLKVKKAGGILDPERPTDNARAAIAAKMIGDDPSDVEGYDLLKPLEDVETVRQQGINAEIWALIASSVCGRDLTAAETYRQDIIKMQLDSGAVSFDGTTADVDITAMAVQALAPFKNEDDRAIESVDLAMSWLESMQEEDGGFGNAESTAQVILALDALGEDPAGAESFNDKERDLYRGLMAYHVPGGFCHKDEDEADGMATEQALCALDAIVLATNGMSFYEAAN